MKFFVSEQMGCEYVEYVDITHIPTRICRCIHMYVVKSKDNVEYLS